MHPSVVVSATTRSVSLAFKGRNNWIPPPKNYECPSANEWGKIRDFKATLRPRRLCNSNYMYSRIRGWLDNTVIKRSCGPLAKSVMQSLTECILIAYLYFFISIAFRPRHYLGLLIVIRYKVQNIVVMDEWAVMTSYRYVLLLHHADVFTVSCLHSSRPQLSSSFAGDARHASLGETLYRRRWRMPHEASIESNLITSSFSHSSTTPLP